MRTSAWIVAAIGAGLMAGAAAQVKPEKLIEYRQDALSVMGFNFGQMAAQVKGDKPYDKDDFARRAANVEFLSKLPMEGFAPGTDKGHDTKAKPEIWTKMDDFKAKMEKMQTEAAKLAAISKTGSFDEIKKQFGATGSSCKSCHDDYRNK